MKFFPAGLQVPRLERPIVSHQSGPHSHAFMSAFVSSCHPGLKIVVRFPGDKPLRVTWTWNSHQVPVCCVLPVLPLRSHMQTYLGVNMKPYNNLFHRPQTASHLSFPTFSGQSVCLERTICGCLNSFVCMCGVMGIGSGCWQMCALLICAFSASAASGPSGGT